MKEKVRCRIRWRKVSQSGGSGRKRRIKVRGGETGKTEEDPRSDIEVKRRRRRTDNEEERNLQKENNGEEE